MAPQQIANALDSFARDVYNSLQTLRPSRQIARRALKKDRIRALDHLNDLVANSPYKFQGTVLSDFMWDNGIYWMRYSIIRAALGLDGSQEYAVTGPWERQKIREIIAQMNISRSISFDDQCPSKTSVLNQARELIENTKSNFDILSWKLPYDFPGMLVYDSILKRQQLSSVDINHPRFEDHVVEVLQFILAAEKVVETAKPALVLVSHTLDARYGSVAWVAAKKGVQVVQVFGNFGSLRFWKMNNPEEIFDWMCRPVGSEMDALSEDEANAYAKIGAEYIQQRYQGNTLDIGAVYAYQLDRQHIEREEFCRRMGWDPEKPIIGVYGSAWYDFPHTSKMTFFRDFEDWMVTTYERAKSVTQFNWLFRAHPCEEWYGTVRIHDVMPNEDIENIRVIGPEISGAAMKDICTAFMTIHGSVAIEVATEGKPVMAADYGWFHDCGFVAFPGSRDGYLEAIGSRWWDDMDLRQIARRAQIFAGWYYCVPSWQGDFIFGDDADQDKVYAGIPDQLACCKDAVKQEIQSIHEWMNSDSRFYQTWKMAPEQAREYQMPDIRR